MHFKVKSSSITHLGGLQESDTAIKNDDIYNVYTHACTHTHITAVFIQKYLFKKICTALAETVLYSLLPQDKIEMFK